MAAVTSGLVIYITPMLNSPTLIRHTAEEPAPGLGLAPVVVALGYLEPASTVLNLSVPLALEGDRVAELLVTVGEAVEAGQVIAVLDSKDRLMRSLTQSQARLQEAERSLALVRAGEKEGAIAAQQATVTQLKADLEGTISAQGATLDRLRAEQRNAQVEFERFAQLYQQGAVSTSAQDEKQVALEIAQARVAEAEAEQGRSRQTLQSQIAAAQATLNDISEVRPESLTLAQAEVDSAAAALALATTELSQAQIRAPISGKVLNIHSYPGEKIGEQGIVELGQTQRMIVVAEVDESDIQQIQIGQSAVIVADAFANELAGEVERIGQTVIKQSVFSNQPGSNLDSRVVEVRIALNAEDSQKAADLTNLQVEAAIQTDEAL